MSVFDTNTEYLAPAEIYAARGPKIFLAGTIEMGGSIDWQKHAFNCIRNNNCSVFNPRRKNWDSKLEQTIQCTEFVEQVVWEQNALKAADIILFNFLPGTYSLISLLEFGQFCIPGNRNKKVVVCCPTSYMRSGNIQIMCSMYEIPLFRELDDAIAHINIIM